MFSSITGIQEVKAGSKIKDLIHDGPLHQYSIDFYINRDKGIVRRWNVFSQGKRSTLVNYLFGKLLWDELNRFEKTIFFNLSEITSDFTIYNTLKAIVLGTSKKDVRKRLENGSFLGLNYISKDRYLMIKHRVNFFFLAEEVSLRRVTKYSGYTKHYKDKGSLRPHIETYVSPSTVFFTNISERTVIEYLTVGKIPFFQGEGVFYPEDANKQKRKSKKNEVKVSVNEENE